MPTVKYPSLYELNTRVWLRQLSDNLGRVVTLENVPDEAIDRLARAKFDWIWMLGVWQTGEASQRVSRTNPIWRREFEETLADLSEGDILGSGFAISQYHVHASLGGDAAMASFRQRLKQRGLHLMLDFVPNHTALDHVWVEEHPEYFVPGTPQDLLRSPENYTRVARNRGDLIMAYGRDPYFPGWPDTLQLDYSHPAVVDAMTSELLKVASQCDGVRCDMAMLLMPEVFQRTWNRLPKPFWPDAIAAVRQAYPKFCFLAEVYWDLEWTMQQQGFDFTYDKRLYDRLRDGSVQSIRAHLDAPLEFQNRLARFLENHDEPRAAATFEMPKHQAAAVVTYLSPGLRFFHQGQFVGRRKRISPHLGRGPNEVPNDAISEFYNRLLEMLSTPTLRLGQWQPLECRAPWDGNWTTDCLIAMAWEYEQVGRLVVVINYAANQSQGLVPIPFAGLPGKSWRLEDVWQEATYIREGDELAARGLFVDLAPWGVSVFRFDNAN